MNVSTKKSKKVFFHKTVHNIVLYELPKRRNGKVNIYQIPKKRNSLRIIFNGTRKTYYEYRLISSNYLPTSLALKERISKNNIFILRI